MDGIVSQLCHILLPEESDPVRWGCHLRRWVCSLRISSLQPTQAYLWQGRRAFAKSHQSVPRRVRLCSQSLTAFSVCSCSVLLPGFTHKGSETRMISSECESTRALPGSWFGFRMPACLLLRVCCPSGIGQTAQSGILPQLIQWSEGSPIPLRESSDLCLSKCLQLF